MCKLFNAVDSVLCDCGMQIAPMLNGRIDIRYRRVECTPPVPVKVQIDGNSGPGGWLRLSVTVSAPDCIEMCLLLSLTALSSRFTLVESCSAFECADKLLNST